MSPAGASWTGSLEGVARPPLPSAPVVPSPWAAAQTRDVRTSSSRSDTTSTSTSSNTSGGGGGREGGDAPLLPVMDVRTQRDAATVGGVSQTWSPARSVCLFAWGFVMGAPLQKWFLFLSRLGGTPVTLPKVILKVVLNQGAVGPIVNSMFFGYTLLVRQGPNNFSGLEDFVDRWRVKLSQDLLPTTIISACCWGPYHVVSFLFIPEASRFFWVNVFTVLWTAYLSWRGFNDRQEVAVEDAAKP